MNLKTLRSKRLCHILGLSHLPEGTRVKYWKSEVTVLNVPGEF